MQPAHLQTVYICMPSAYNRHVVEMSFAQAVDEFAAWLLTARGRSTLTVREYCRDLHQFARDTAVASLPQLDSASVNRWKARMGQTDASGKPGHDYSPRSQARKLSALRSFVSWAMEYGHLKSSPISPELQVLKAMYLPHALSESEVSVMLEEAQGESPTATR